MSDEEQVREKIAKLTELIDQFPEGEEKDRYKLNRLLLEKMLAMGKRKVPRD